jgi:hypothetical protein
MAATLPASSPQSTFSSKFQKVYLNGVKVGGATDVEYGMNYDGTWEQPIGEDRPVNNPDKRYGDGTIQQIKWAGASLNDICIAAGLTTQQDAATGDADLRFFTFTLGLPYQDGVKQFTDTCYEVYIRKARRRVEGNRLIMDNISFEYVVHGSQ